MTKGMKLLLLVLVMGLFATVAMADGAAEGTGDQPTPPPGTWLRPVYPG